METGAYLSVSLSAVFMSVPSCVCVCHKAAGLKNRPVLRRSRAYMTNQRKEGMNEGNEEGRNDGMK